MEEPMSKKRRKNRRYTESFKAAAVERMKLGCNVSELARELKVSRTLLYMWFLSAAEGGEKDADASKGELGELQQRVAWLEGVIGRQKLEADFLSAALRRIEAKPQRKKENGGTKSTPKSPTGLRSKAN
jgi:transposase-like protein